MKNVVIDGIEYSPVAKGLRYVVVIDRGWIFAGDLSEENGRLRLSRVVWLFRWESIGLDGVISNPKSSKVTLKPYPNIDIPSDCEIFRVPVSEDWGI